MRRGNDSPVLFLTTAIPAGIRHARWPAGHSCSRARNPWLVRSSVPPHVRASYPGHIEGNGVFAYLDAFDADHAAVETLKTQYRVGGLGDVVVKRRLDDVLQALLEPIRTRRATLARDPKVVLTIIERGSGNARKAVTPVLTSVRQAFQLR